MNRQKHMWLALSILLAPLALSSAHAEPHVFRPGDKALDGSKLQPFEARYELAFGGEVQGHRRFHLQEAHFSGEEGLHFTKTMEHAETSFESVQFVRASLRPVMRNVAAMERAHRVEVWHGDKIRGFEIEADGSAAEKVEISSDGERFSASQYLVLLATLPLAKGYEATIPLVLTGLGPERTNVTAAVSVKGREEIKAKNGKKYSAWVIDSRVSDAAGNAVRPPTTYWLADQPPYLIRSDTGGGRMLQELVETR